MVPQTEFTLTQLMSQFISQTGAEWVLWVLLLLSVISVSVMVERAVFFIRHRIDADRFIKELIALLDKGDHEEAQKLAGGRRGMEAAVALDGLKVMGKGAKAAEEMMGSAVSRERSKYEQNLSILATLGTNAPFIGLFGTVLGIIKAFSDLALNITGGAEAVMGGVSQALVTTAVGILVALPAVVAFNLFRGKVKQVLRHADMVARAILANTPSSGEAS